jgi:hypothetical protein
VSIVPKYFAAAYRDFDLKALKLACDVPAVEVFQFWLRTQIREMFDRPKAVQALLPEAACGSVHSPGP